MVKMVVSLATLLAVGLALTAAAQVQYVNDLDNVLDSALDEGFDSPLTPDLRMAGGKIVEESSDSYRFMVAIRPQYQEGGTTRSAPVCSGVLIQGNVVNQQGAVTPSYYVLTSAHCALSGTSFQLFAGSNKITSTQNPTETVTATQAVDNVIINSEYRESMLTGDIALINVSTIAPTTATAGAGSITTANLASAIDATKSFLVNPVSMAGWGYPNDVFNGPSPSLRELTSWVVPNWYCAVRHITLPIRKTHMCTAGLPNKGPCTGDSGAPLIAKVTRDNVASTKVVGVATHTPRDGCSRGKPGVFTRVGDYLDWIVQITGYDVDSA
ncbi:chymotrypsin-2-like isoform X1 [Frankliniella occidentalis]|uniref:Chymotrypsin-2-like isoform X1 n=1 Tax=Frankliniella occidentalis TaxID=133901 RepID=A0A6J1STI8_FRAOC|nr:chymotrypsin-2-like isoform X1 [Frankliniella occidentalis]